MKTIPLSLNQIILPNSSFEDFISFAKKLKIDAVEIRNDIKSNLIQKNDPSKIKNLSMENSIKILSINALQKFNIWNNEREKELITLCRYADKANINAIVLVPLNDGSINSAKQQIQLLEQSLLKINKIIDDFNVFGLVEPLGFTSSSLRYKSLAVNTIQNIQSKKLKIIHDTFHHALADEKEFFPSLTGLVHISGVSNIYQNSKLKDDYRSIIDENDILNNLKQIQRLFSSDYEGYFSFEPFSNSLIEDNNVLQIIQNSLKYIQANL